MVALCLIFSEHAVKGEKCIAYRQMKIKDKNYIV